MNPELALVPERAPVAEPAPEQLSPRERLERLCDPGTLQVFRSSVGSRSARGNGTPGDGVVAAGGSVGGRPVLCYSQDRSFMGGSLGQAHADTIVRLLGLAEDGGVPVVAFVESGGARMDEGTAALGGYGRIFRGNVRLSGWVPQISVVCGTSAGGGSYSPALTDFVLMTEPASMFLTGPGVVSEVMGEQVSKHELGGPRVHSRNGVCDLVAGGESEAIDLVHNLLGHLPQNTSEAPPAVLVEEPLAADPSAAVPDEPRRVYDVRTVIRCLADGSRMLELSPRWARNMVTAFTRVAGRPVGVIANQPKHLGGVIDHAASEKAARFVRRCDSFGVPLVVLVDTPGFLPGTRQEAAGVIRRGADLLHAFSAARVPKLTVVLRKAYGGGFITMNSKDLGADLVLAWPQAEIGVVGPKQAVSFVHRKQIAESDDPAAERDRLAEEYARDNATAEVAARDGHVDELIDPADTRARLAWALATRGARRR